MKLSKDCKSFPIIDCKYVFIRDGDYLEVHNSAGLLMRFSGTKSCIGKHKLTIGYRPSLSPNQYWNDVTTYWEYRQPLTNNGVPLIDWEKKLKSNSSGH